MINFLKKVNDYFIQEPASSLVQFFWYFAAFVGFLVWTSILSTYFDFGVDLLQMIFDFLYTQGKYINAFGLLVLGIFGVGGTFYFIGLIWAILKAIK
jgi:hypothetical protein